MPPVVFAFFYLPFPQTTNGHYLDPGSGSIIIQVVIALTVGGLFTVKLFWHRIKSFLRSLFSGGSEIERSEK